MLKDRQYSPILFQENKDKVVLLVHAFQTAPVVFEQLAKQLFAEGFSVYNIRLGGHGTVAEEQIFDYSWNDWVKQVENIYLDMTSMFKNVYGIGLCLGADILLEVAVKHKSLKKMVLYSPPLYWKLKIKHLIYIPLVYLFGLKKVKNKEWNLPDPADPVIDSFTSFFPVQRGLQLGKHIKKLARKVDELESDVLCFLSEQDRVIPFEPTKNVIESRTGFSLIVLEKSGHFIPIDVETEFVFKRTLEHLKK